MSPTLCNRKLKVLCELSRLIGRALELDKTLADMLRILSQALTMKRGTLTLFDPESDSLVIRASHGLTVKEIGRGVYRRGEGVTGRIFETGQPVVIPDVRRERQFLDRTGSRRKWSGPLTFMGVPILVQGKVAGVLTVDRLFDQEISFEEDIEFLTVVAALIAQLVSLNQQVKAREEELRRANLSLKAEISEKYQDFYLVGKSRVMRRTQELARKVAESPATVLLLGESGTGKTLIARIIHEMSSRSGSPFIKLNCAAIPESLLESELFGHEKGAFTGADKAKPGRVELAQGGTLFLDEIGDLPLRVQTKLLRFLQEKEYERLGSTTTQVADVRLVAATNRELEKAVIAGDFREDLYYRLNVFPIHVPPLRERAKDIPLLLDHFLEKFARRYRKTLRLSPEATSTLRAYPWPGNVREMENMAERLAILYDGRTIEREDLPAHIIAADEPTGRPATSESAPLASAPGVEAIQKPAVGSGNATLGELERGRILDALERAQWVRVRAAEELGITVRQLGYRIRKYDLEEAVFRGKQNCRR